MRCVFCKSAFHRLSWSGPSEPCDCGQCITKDEAQELTLREYAEALERAKEALK